MLEIIWFMLWGLLWAVYFMLDGFDLGLGALLPWVTKDEQERKTAYNAMGPYWDGNEVWLVAAGGVTFAAFPAVYAVMFSSLYSALLLLLFALIFRGAAIALRAESESMAAKRAWDVLFFSGSATSSALFGVVFANLFRGLPLDAHGVNQGGFFDLLNPYGLLGGVLFLVMFLFHGALWLAVKAKGELSDRAGALAFKLWFPLAALAAGFLFASWYATSLYDNYLTKPGLFVIPGLAIAALLGAGHFARRKKWLWAWMMNALFIVYAVFFGIFGMYPSLLISSISRLNDLTIANSASSPLTLKIMLGVVLVFVPLVIVYQAWSYSVFSGKVGPDEDGYGGHD